MRRLLFPLAWFLLVASAVPAFDLAEMDGDDEPGDALCLLGWDFETSPHPLPVFLVRPLDGPISDDLDDATAHGAMRRAFRAWQDVESSWLAFDLDGDASPHGTDGMLLLSADRGISATGITPFNDDGRKLPLPDSDGNRNVVAFVEHGWNELPPAGPDEEARPGPYGFGFSPTALAITVYAFSSQTRHVTGFDILVNGEHFDNARLGAYADLDTGALQAPVNWGWADLPDGYVPDPATDPAPLANPPYQDLANTLTHEIGHAIGLSHADPTLHPDATMVFSAAGGETCKRSLSEDDVRGLTFLYPEQGAEIVAPDRNGPGVPERSVDAAGGCAMGRDRGLELTGLLLLLPAALLLRRPRG